MSRTLLLTGATGLVGSELLRRVLAWEPEAEVVALLRAPSDAHVQLRGARLLTELAPDPAERPAWGARVRFLRGNLTAPELGLAPEVFEGLARQLTDIVHAAASVRFDLPLEEARAVNVGGARGVLGLAARAVASGSLQRLHHVSTIAVAGRRGGLILETPAAGGPYNNTYEQSKAEAEALVLAAAPDIPVSVHRISQVFGDSRTGWTPTFRMSYLFARVVLAGVLPVLPLADDVVIDGVTIDYAADALYALIFGAQPASGAIYHLAAGHEAPSGREWVLSAITRNLHRDSLATRSVRFVSPDAFRAMRGALEASLDDGGRALLAQADLLIPHLDLPARVFDDTCAAAALAGTGVEKRTPYECLAIDEYCFRTGFGAAPEPRPALPPRPVGRTRPGGAA